MPHTKGGAQLVAAELAPATTAGSHTPEPTMLIHPAEQVTVPLGALHTVVTNIIAAAQYGEPFRTEIIASVRTLSSNIYAASRHDGTYDVIAHAELVWWLVQGAEEIGHTHDMSPVSPLFDATETLTVILADTAPRTAQGLAAVIDAEVTLALAEHAIETERRGDQ